MHDYETLLTALLDLDWGGFGDDLLFYESLARRCDGPLLELGCGTGRVALPLARAGFDVTGIDLSEAALAFARCKAEREHMERLRLERADMRDFELGRRFELVFAGFGAFHHLLTPDDQLACLRCVERHLTPGGLFVCDLRPLREDDWDEGASVPLLHDWTRPLPGSDQTVMKFRSIAIDRPRQLQRETHLYDIVSPNGALRRVTTTVDLRFSSRYEMEGLLREAGLELDRFYGDFDLSPYDDESELVITVARKLAKESG
jgi:SAM-dependent methyltransferase